ncbi:ferredoxin [Enteractinococcus helveticum]|uniref:Ferredoxin n=1 Tax=Enteractinococcus helveticum TaxID=1837282 RepID=A0A1B7LUJ1_9MICC|nr:ferredoxin [Enteractinococcus helveticum]OAV51050.1 ferredoxin [Enteractinococcus helveticum]
MKIAIDTDKCIAAGACVMEAIEVFDQRDEDGVVILLDENPSEDQHDNVRRAAHACPAKAITLQE